MGGESAGPCAPLRGDVTLLIHNDRGERFPGVRPQFCYEALFNRDRCDKLDIMFSAFLNFVAIVVCVIVKWQRALTQRKLEPPYAFQRGFGGGL